MAFVAQLKALASLPVLLNNEAHALADRLDILAALVRQALNRQPEPPPPFVLVLLQAQLEDGAPTMAAMSGRMLNRKTLRLQHTLSRAVRNLTVLVFADLEQVRIESITAGNHLLQQCERGGGSSAPIAYDARGLGAGTHVAVELGAR